jgi:hypothetical protein
MMIKCARKNLECVKWGEGKHVPKEQRAQSYDSSVVRHIGKEGGEGGKEETHTRMIGAARYDKKNAFAFGFSPIGHTAT